MAGIALLLVAAVIGYGLARLLDTPTIPLLLLAGVLVARTGVLPPELLEDAIILGVTFLLFVTGIELSPERVRTQRALAIRVGVLQFSALAAAGFIVAAALGFGPLSAIYLALALTASSTLVIVRLLQHRRQMFEPFGRLVIGVLLLQNLLVILFIPVVTRLPDGIAAIGRGLLGTAALLALTWLAYRHLAPRILRLDGDDEPLLLGVLALLFAFIALADVLGLPLVAGAFLAGVALSPFPVNGVVRSQLQSIGDFFSAIFFTALGALTSIPSAGELGQALVLALVVILATPPLVAFVAEAAGFAARPAVESGLLLAQTSELSLVIGLYGMIEGQIGNTVLTVIAAVTVITMLLTPFLSADRVALWLLPLHPVRREARPPPPAGGHVLVLGAGSSGMPLVETLVGYGRRVVVVDDDPAVVQRLRDADVPCVRGHAADPDVLERARAREARVITSTLSRPEDNRRVLEYARGVPVLVRVFDAADAEWVRAHGGRPVLYSEATADGMLRWFEHRLAHPRPDTHE